MTHYSSLLLDQLARATAKADSYQKLNHLLHERLTQDLAKYASDSLAWKEEREKLLQQVADAEAQVKAANAAGVIVGENHEAMKRDFIRVVNALSWIMRDVDLDAAEFAPEFHNAAEVLDSLTNPTP
jgi:uncharacterized membrane protein YccC